MNPVLDAASYWEFNPGSNLANGRNEDTTILHEEEGNFARRGSTAL